MQQHQFICQILKPEDLQECALGLAKCFSQIEFVTHLNVTQEHLQPFMRNIGKVGLKRGLSIKIVDQKTGKIAGCSLNIDTVDEQEFQTESLAVQFNPLLKCLQDVSHEHLEKHHAFNTHGKWAHIWCIGVFKQYQGKKLTRRMLDYSLKIFKQKNYKYACAQLVNPLTQRTFIHSSKYFKQINKIVYNQYIYEGVKVMPNATQCVFFAQAQLDSINIQQ